MSVVRSCIGFAVAVAIQSAAAVDGASAKSGLFAVDSRPGDRRSVASVSVGYAPSWSAGSLAGANVVLERVDHAGMNSAVTTTVATCAADAEGVHVIAAETGKTAAFRLIHRTELNGSPVGEPLVSDVAIGVASQPGEEFAVDSRVGSLQLIASDHGTASLVYDTSWTNNAAHLSIAVTDGAVTNELLSVDADATGTYEYPMADVGVRRLLLTFFDADSETIDTLVSEPFKVSGGMLLILK